MRPLTLVFREKQSAAMLPVSVILLASLLAGTLSDSPPPPLPEFSRWKRWAHRYIAGTECIARPGRYLCLRGEKLGAKCSHPINYCAIGAACDDGVCKKFAGMGDSCGPKTKVVCHREFSCRNDVCTIWRGLGSECDDEWSTPCDSGLKCVKSGSNSICKLFVGLGRNCTGNFACKNCLTCTGSRSAPICKRTVERGQNCCRNMTMCGKGHGCAGPVGDKRCKEVMDIAGDCSDALNVSRTGYKCVVVVPKRICPTAVALGERCGFDGMRCEKETECIRRWEDFFDFSLYFWSILVDVGGDCSDRDYFCKKGLDCIQGFRNGELGKAKCWKTVATAEMCNGETIKCEKGDVCVSSPGGKRCWKVKTLPRGGICSGVRNYKCAMGDECVPMQVTPSSSISFCRKVVALGGKCPDRDHVCRDGLACTGTGSNRICTKTATTGEKCNGKAIICENGHACIGPAGDSRCKKVVHIGSDCESSDVVCGTGLTCRHAGPKKICAETAPRGS